MTWDRLAEYLDLEKAATEKEVFVINRSFDTPIETMFDMWTKPEHFAQWLAPTGFTIAFGRADIRTGGESFYSMTNGAMTMYGGVQYHDVHRSDLLVHTQWFADEHENVSRHPASPTWPAKMLTTVLLASEGPAQTRVTVRWSVADDTTAAEIATFAAAKAGMTQGWTGSFDKLDDVLLTSPTVQL